MSLISLADAAAHCRVDSDYPAEQLQGYVDGAEAAAAAYLNCAIFQSQGALDTAVDGIPAKAAEDAALYAGAIEAAAALQDVDERRAFIEVATKRRDDAALSRARLLNGVVANPAIFSAIKLTLGTLFANREDVAIANNVLELPLSARVLLRPYRRVMSP